MFFRKYIYQSFSIFLALTLFTPVSFGLSQSPFVDIPADYEFIQALTSLKNRGVIKGYPDQSFGPDKPISRAEFLKMAMVSSGVKVKAGANLGAGGAANTISGDTNSVQDAVKKTDSVNSTAGGVTGALDTVSGGINSGADAAKKAGVAPVVDADFVFKDVTKDDWFYEYVRDAKAAGFVKGFDDGTFRPHQGVTRAEGLKMLFQAYNVKAEFSGAHVGSSGETKAGVIRDAIRDGDQGATSQMALFSSDLNPNDWFFSFAMAARERLIMSDYDDSFFRPHQPLTRGSAAEILFRFDTVYKNKLTIFDIASEWESFQSPTGGFSLKKPRNWSVIPEATRTVFFKEDPNFLQQDYAFLAPLSAKIIARHPVSVPQNSAAEYFNEVKKFHASLFEKDAVQFSEMTVSGYPTLRVTVAKKLLENFYVYAGNQKAVIFYSEVGAGSLSGKFQRFIAAIISTVQLNQFVPEVDKKEFEMLMSQIQSNILVEAKGKVTFDLLPDEIILETDEIGVGTGPVDYYFSEKMNLTLKYERASDMILAVRASKTTRF